VHAAHLLQSMVLSEDVLELQQQPMELDLQKMELLYPMRHR
jgi:hypothetical protein